MNGPFLEKISDYIIQIDCKEMMEDYREFMRNVSDDRFKMKHNRLISKMEQHNFKNRQIIKFKKSNGERFYLVKIKLLNDYLVNTHPHFKPKENLKNFVESIVPEEEHKDENN